jgi:hypothetical protein
MQPFLLKNINSDSKLIRLNIIIIIIMCLYLIFKYISTSFNLKNIEKLGDIVQPTLGDIVQPTLIDINTLEKNIIENIKLYLNYVELLLLNNTDTDTDTVTVTSKLKILANQENIIDTINKQFEIELAPQQGRTLTENALLRNIKIIFNDCKEIIQTITKNIKQLQEYINIIYDFDTTLNIKDMIIERDTLFNKTNNLIKNFIDMNPITQNDTDNIKQLKKLINNILLRIQSEKLPYYDIKRLIETNIEQIRKYDEQINVDPPLQDVNNIKLSRFNLYNKTNNIVNIEKANRPDTDLNKAAFNSFYDSLLLLKKE